MTEQELLREHRRRVQEACAIIKQAVEANRRVYEIECEAMEHECELSSACWPLLNEECLKDWLEYLRVKEILDDP